MKSKKSWAEKLNDPKPHVIKPVPIAIAGMKVGQIMLVPSAKIVDRFIRTIPHGKALDVRTLRQCLARKHKAEVTCPITTGFHLRTIAEAAYAAYKRGSKLSEVTPFWRVVDEDMAATKKLSCGAAFVATRRSRECIRQD